MQRRLKRSACSSEKSPFFAPSLPTPVNVPLSIRLPSEAGWDTFVEAVSSSQMSLPAAGFPFAVGAVVGAGDFTRTSRDSFSNTLVTNRELDWTEVRLR